MGHPPPGESSSFDARRQGPRGRTLGRGLDQVRHAKRSPARPPTRICAEGRRLTSAVCGSLADNLRTLCGPGDVTLVDRSSRQACDGRAPRSLRSLTCVRQRALLRVRIAIGVNARSVRSAAGRASGRSRNPLESHRLAGSPARARGLYRGGFPAAPHRRDQVSAGLATEAEAEDIRPAFLKRLQEYSSEVIRRPQCGAGYCMSSSHPPDTRY